MTRKTELTPIAAVLDALPAQCEAEADRCEVYNPGAAYAWRTAAQWIRAGIERQKNEVLTLAEAARESGYSADHLRHLVSSGAVENKGRKHAPRIARGDLPKRVGKKSGSAYDPSTDALSLVAKRGA